MIILSLPIYTFIDCITDRPRHCGTWMEKDLAPAHLDWGQTPDPNLAPRTLEFLFLLRIGINRGGLCNASHQVYLPR